MRPIFLMYLLFRNTNSDLCSFKTGYLSKKKKNDVKIYLATPNYYYSSKNEFFTPLHI